MPTVFFVLIVNFERKGIPDSDYYLSETTMINSGPLYEFQLVVECRQDIMLIHGRCLTGILFYIIDIMGIAFIFYSDSVLC